MPLHNSILSYVPVATLCLYFQGQTSSLLANNKYATSFSLDDCEDGCTSFILPGGIETARRYKPFLNETLLDGSIQDIDSDVMRIMEAPGFVLKFENVVESFSFNLSSDCVYAGQSFKDSLMVCARQVNESIAFGELPPFLSYFTRTPNSTSNISINRMGRLPRSAGKNQQL
jgi:hypothetical protein